MEDTNINKTHPKKPVSYSCDLCQFKTGNKKDYNRHCLTAKHKMETNRDKTIEKGKNIFPQFKCKCGKQYYSRQGIHKHKQGCTKGVELVDKEMVMKLLEQNNELQKKILELASKPTTQIVNNNTKNIQNKFNLNDSCKNENMGKPGYVEYITILNQVMTGIHPDNVHI